jgi:hypothetical protein
MTSESDSRLTWIEYEPFHQCSLQSIVIPRNVQFIGGSAFIGVTWSSISIESGNEMSLLKKTFWLMFSIKNWFGIFRNQQ